MIKRPTVIISRADQVLVHGEGCCVICDAWVAAGMPKDRLEPHLPVPGTFESGNPFAGDTGSSGHAFRPGDLVVLRSGGPLMTFDRYTCSSNEVILVYFKGCELTEETLGTHLVRAPHDWERAGQDGGLPL